MHPRLCQRRTAMLIDADNLLGTLPAHSAASMAVALVHWLHTHNGLSIVSHKTYANPSTRGLGRGQTLRALLDATESELVPTSARRYGATVFCP